MSRSSVCSTPLMMDLRVILMASSSVSDGWGDLDLLHGAFESLERELGHRTQLRRRLLRRNERRKPAFDLRVRDFVCIQLLGQTGEFAGLVSLNASTAMEVAYHPSGLTNGDVEPHHLLARRVLSGAHIFRVAEVWIDLGAADPGLAQ